MGQRRLFEKGWVGASDYGGGRYLISECSRERILGQLTLEAGGTFLRGLDLDLESGDERSSCDRFNKTVTVAVLESLSEIPETVNLIPARFRRTRF